MSDPSPRERELLDFLRRGDPLRAEPPLAPAEAGAIRRRIVEVAVARPRALLVPLLATAGTVVLLAVALVLVGNRLSHQDPGAHGVGMPPQAAVANVPAARAESPQVALEETLAGSPDPATQNPARQGAPLRIADAGSRLRTPVVPARSEASAAPARRPRQFQTVTERGTRIVWVLDPEFSL